MIRIVNAQDYNDPRKLDERLKDLASLHDIVRTRRDLAQQFADLKGYVFVGQVYSDEMGHCYRMFPYTRPAGKSIPAACTLEDFAAIIGTPPPHGSWYDQTLSIERGYFELPTPNRVCPICNRGWNLANAGDAFVEMEVVEDFSLSDFVGKTFAEAHDALLDRPDARYELSLKRDGYIVRPAGVPAYSALFRQEGNLTIGPTLKEQQDWRAQHRGVLGGYVIQRGDSMEVTRYVSWHGGCYTLHKEKGKTATLKLMGDSMERMFYEVGFTNVDMQPAPVPDSVAETLRQGERSDLNQVKAAMTYFRIVTDQGVFGFVQMQRDSFIALDGTNLSGIDFGTPLGRPPFKIVLMDPQRQHLHRLFELLTTTRDSK